MTKEDLTLISKLCTPESQLVYLENLLFSDPDISGSAQLKIIKYIGELADKIKESKQEKREKNNDMEVSSE